MPKAVSSNLSAHCCWAHAICLDVTFGYQRPRLQLQAAMRSDRAPRRAKSGSDLWSHRWFEDRPRPDSIERKPSTLFAKLDRVVKETSVSLSRSRRQPPGESLSNHNGRVTSNTTTQAATEVLETNLSWLSS